MTATICVAVTLLFNAAEFDLGLGTRRFHVGLSIAEAMVLVFVAAVLIGRYRYAGSQRNLLLLTAAVVLAVKNLCFAVATALTEDDIPGDHFTVWATAISGLIGAVLLAGAALVRDRRTRPIHAGTMIVVGVAVVAATMIVAGVLADLWPNAFQTDLVPDALQTPPEDVNELGLLGGHPAKIVLDVLTAACYGLAAVAFSKHADEHDDEFVRWLSISAVIAAVAFVDYALSPSQFARLFYGAELLWIGAIGTLLCGAVREISNLEAALVRSVLLEERLRVARDRHDGVAQELAYISSQADWFLRQPTDPQRLARIMDAAQRGLEESRGAIAGLDRPIDEPLVVAVEHAAHDVADRVGARVQVDLDNRVEVTPEWRDALLRVTRVAVANAVRHGHARTLTVELRGGDATRLRITDDGEGFDVEAPRSAQSFGLAGMREWTESLGGRFSITSAPGEGASVEVVIP